ncbi:MAG: circularly permuted type 2 ATP-grasp protein, partial [Ilumatobacteraceae bacterium]
MSVALSGRFDESLMWDDGLRSRLLDEPRLLDWQQQLDRLLVAEGAGHLVHDLPVRADGRGAGLTSRPWRLDPVPFVIDTPTFQWLASAVVERMAALESVLADLYGPRHLVRDGVVPSDLLHSTHRYRLAMVDAPSPDRWLTTYSVDLVRTRDGVWKVVQDLTDAPPGLGYALLDRSVMARVAGEVHGGSGAASLARYPGLVRRALASVSSAESPRTVLFTGGIEHPSYVDHSYLAVQLGVHLVEGADLVVRQRRLWLRTLDGLEPVDVVYRRLEDPGIDPLEVGSTGDVGVPGLLLAVRAGGVALANAHGAGVLEEAGLAPSWDDAMRHLQGASQRLGRYDPATDAGAGLATTPMLGGTGLTTGEVVVRLFAASDGERTWVLPGGSGRVLAPGDDPRFPTACAAKDVWVIGDTLSPIVVAPLPQVDFGRSVPTRAAAALFWMNRAAERAEAIARSVRVVSARVEQDPGLGSLDGGRWSDRMQWLVRSLRRASDDASPLPGLDALHDELSRASDAVADQIGVLLTEATTVREFLSVTTGRVLEQLARRRADLRRHVVVVDEMDALLTDFAALVGLWNESVVRGPAWRLGDMGRRLERAQVLLDMAGPGLTGPGFTDPGISSSVDPD